MAGHSKFKNIMHRKGAQDVRRAKQFAKVIRELTVAVRSGLPDPSANPRLRAALLSAREVNMPNDNVERAIRKATGETGGADYAEVRYEGYGPGGVAIVIEGLTDNRNRTAAEIRAAFSKFGGSMGESNSVIFMFRRRGVIFYPDDKATPDEMLEAAVEAGANDVVSDAEGHEVITDFETFLEVRESLEEKFGRPETAKTEWNPETLTAVDIDQARTLIKLLDALEENDDVQAVYANYDMSDEVAKELA